MGNQKGPNAPAGWYPSDKSGESPRYWDGKTWTNPPEAAEKKKPGKRFVLLVAAAVALLALALSGVAVYTQIAEANAKAEAIAAKNLAYSNAIGMLGVAYNECSRFTLTKNWTKDPNSMSLSFTDPYPEVNFAYPQAGWPCVQSMLKLPTSITEKMKITRAIDGIQSSSTEFYKAE